jgi:hypothetical protein
MGIPQKPPPFTELLQKLTSEEWFDAILGLTRQHRRQAEG